MVRRPRSEEMKALNELLNKRGVPKAGPCSPYIRNWWQDKALPTLMDHALSELRRLDQFSPKLLGFMRDGKMGVIDIAAATRGQFGDAHSKDATAAVHQFSARIPGVMASVFCVETWILRSDGSKERDEILDQRGSIANHPDRGEAMMFNMLHCDPLTNTMMQLITMREVIKVLGANRSRKAWADTKYADAIATTDPMGERKDDGEYASMKGRFIYGDDDDE